MIHLADVSEHQGPVDWAAYGAKYGAVIVRAHNGNRPDNLWEQNRDGARAHCRVRGWYQYLLSGVDPVAQADQFCSTVGALQPGEFVVCDVESGVGSQVDRATTWLNAVDKTLRTHSWLYSFEYFATTKLGALVPFATRNTWVANYRLRPPDLPFTLWQHTDAEAHAGIAAPCDCSIYSGSLDDLAHLVNPTPGGAMARFPNAVDACWAPNGGVWVLGSDGGVGAYGGAPFAGSYPGLPPDQRQGDRAFLRIMASRIPGKLYDLLADDGSTYSF